MFISLNTQNRPLCYDAWGNNTSVSITSGDQTITSGDQTITSTADYSEDGNRLEFTTDALGQITTYGYNPDTNVLDWVQYPEDTPETRTEYTYDAMYRTATAALETDTGLSLSAEYTYDNDLLTSIKTASTTYNFTYGNFALRGSVAVGNKILASYDYQDGTNWLERLDYGNDDFVQYTYDDQGRVIRQDYDSGAYVTYHYDNNGALARVYDSQTDTTSTYYYDFTDRRMKYVEKSSTGTHSVGYEYDDINNLTALVETIGTVERKTSYTYDGDNRPTSVIAGNSTLNYDYDNFGRVSTLTTKHDGNAFATKTYSYKLNAEEKPTNQVSSVTIQIGSNSQTFTYTYDQNGNITSISDGTYVTNYTYDSANQLIREDNQEANTITLWTYDDAGNILSRTVRPYVPGTEDEEIQTNYYYTDTQWGDLLKSYNSRPIMRDGVGNPTNDFVWRYTWQHGRQLASMNKLDGSAQWNYTYNADGLRTQRTGFATDSTTGVTANRTYNYTYLGGQLTHMTVDGHTMYFTYDASGTPLTMVYDGLKFYYITNLQGDVISIVNGNGTEFVRYTYDAWGNVKATGSATNLRFYNPLRYRGYVYDSETELYYLQSRYYNPEMGRFINGDAYASTGQGLLGNNMFAYCLNNPVNMFDRSGTYPQWHADIIEPITSTATGQEYASIAYGSFNLGKYYQSSLPRTGTPNSSDVLLNPDGTIKQKRWYGPDGNAERDRDYNHGGDLEFPHDHIWENGERGEEHLPPSPEYEFSWDPLAGTAIVTVSIVAMVFVAVDDTSGIGAIDDILYVPLIAWLKEGATMMFK